ncbi:MAG: hypothetical protein KAW17_12100 [Candidatus Eisenbacteria sp.]|nr:hypothetical protein [Candidatus Eisenbacteria bacterium]
MAYCVDMLRFDPMDNQGIRYLMATCLADLGWDDRLEDLLKQFKDDRSAPWAYSAALVAFRREGDTDSSRALLAEALEANSHVPDFMLDRRKLPAQSPALIGYGDESEAIVFTADFVSGWKKTPGALEWLARISHQPRREAL